MMLSLHSSISSVARKTIGVFNRSMALGRKESPLITNQSRPERHALNGFGIESTDCRVRLFVR